MNRLQKKCLFVTAGFHLSLIVILLVGPGFFSAKPPPDDAQILEIIPDVLINEAMSSGVKDAKPPPPMPPQVKPEVTPPPPEPPKPIVKPEPVKIPEPEPEKPPENLKPDDLEPVVKPPKKKPEPHKVEINLTPIVRKAPVVKPDNSEAEAREQAKADQRVRDRNAKLFKSAISSIKENASTATTIEMQGASSVSYASYASAVRTKYEAAWIPPDDTSSDDADVSVKVVIARDGRVISARVVTRSGDASVDRSVERGLERVTFIGPFPDGAKEPEKTFILTFNLKSKRMNG